MAQAGYGHTVSVYFAQNNEDDRRLDEALGLLQEISGQSVSEIVKAALGFYFNDLAQLEGKAA